VANTSAFQNYFAPEVHSPLQVDEHEQFDLTMSTSADGAAGKKPSISQPGAQGPIDTNGANRRLGGTNIVSVEPPKQSDLQVPLNFSRTFLFTRDTDSEEQPSFSHQMPEDPANMGWYGKMINALGGCFGTLGSIPCCICCPNPYKQGTFATYLRHCLLVY